MRLPRFGAEQWIAVSGVLSFLAIVVISVSRASIPVYHDHWEYWAPRIKNCESGYYNEHHRASPGATGAWQIQDPTWANFGGYPRAYMAPPAVQDAKAYDLFQRRGTQPWDASYLCWRSESGPSASKASPAPPSAVNVAPEGGVETAGCQLVGFAFDRTDNTASVGVLINIDGQTVSNPKATWLRPDINQKYGVGLNHGFNVGLPGSLHDNISHHYQVIALDSSDSSQHVIGEGDLTCKPANIGDGGGLSAEYNDGHSGFKRLDSSINFDWGAGAPATGIAADNFTVTWTGKLLAQYSENYTFTATTDDGVRVWVGDKLVIDYWHNQAATPHSGQISLEAGKLYNIRVEYYEAKGRAEAKLQWSSYSTPEQVVPRSQLYADIP